MKRLSMLFWVLALSGAAAPAAPGGEEAFKLVTVNGAALPATSWKNGDCRVETLWGSLVLHPDARFRAAMVEKDVCPSESRPVRYEVFEGRYARNGEVLVLEGAPGLDNARLREGYLEMQTRGIGPYAGQVMVYRMVRDP